MQLSANNEIPRKSKVVYKGFRHNRIEELTFLNKKINHKKNVDKRE